jgi:release factor glutamine methyltransferase
LALTHQDNAQPSVFILYTINMLTFIKKKVSNTIEMFNVAYATAMHLANTRTKNVEDFQEQVLVYPTVYWLPPGTASLRQLIRTSPLVKGKTVLEMCTGSGLLALCCKKAGAQSVVATDINPDAVANAKENAHRLGFSTAIDVRQVSIGNASAFAAIQAHERFDLIVSNPPWENDMPNDIDDYAYYDPGFKLIQSLLTDARNHLTQNGEMYLAYGCVTAIRLIEKMALDLDYSFEILDSRKLSDMEEVFVDSMLLRIKPNNTRPL